MSEIILPLDTKIYAAEVKRERKSEMGIILEGASSIKETAQAKVLAVGGKVEDIKVDDIVYLDWSKTKLVVVDGFQRVLVDREDVMAIVKKDVQ